MCTYMYVLFVSITRPALVGLDRRSLGVTLSPHDRDVRYVQGTLVFVKNRQGCRRGEGVVHCPSSYVSPSNKCKVRWFVDGSVETVVGPSTTDKDSGRVLVFPPMDGLFRSRTLCRLI